MVESADSKLGQAAWSELPRPPHLPEPDLARLDRWRWARLREAMRDADVGLLVATSPISLRYALEFTSYALFQSHIPTAYAFLPLDGPRIIYGSYDGAPLADESRPGRPVAFLEAGAELAAGAAQFVDDVVAFLAEIGCDNRRVAVEYTNPSICFALQARGLEVVDGVALTETARLIKSEEELNCISWSCAVAAHAIDHMREALCPGVSELQLWGLLNYTNLANNGCWHEGRMLASGPRINPWMQEASPRRVEAGDLVGFDTDMVGPCGYFADISRTLFCGPGEPGRRQRELYQLAVAELEHNLALVRPGITLAEFQQQAWPVPEAYQANAYPYVFHGVGMCDEFPGLKPLFKGEQPVEFSLQAGMVLCLESYIGAEGERDGVKLEQQVLVTGDGYELLSLYPLEEALLQ